MRLTNLALIALVGTPLALHAGCSSEDGAPSPEPYAANICVGAKQAAASTFCKTVFDAWVVWETDQDDATRDAAVMAARGVLGDSWDAAEADAAMVPVGFDHKALFSTVTGAVQNVIAIETTSRKEYSVWSSYFEQYEDGASWAVKKAGPQL